MRASDFQIDLPLVERSTSAVDAARLIAANHLAGVVVADARTGHPSAIISSADVLRLMLPPYLLDDPALAGVMDEAGADEMWAKAAERTIGELLDDPRVSVKVVLHVDGDDSLVEVAAKMVDAHAQVAAVGTGDGGHRFVTLPALMDAILDVCDANGLAR